MYLLIFIVTFGISLFATWRVKSMIAKYSQMPASSGFTGAEAARRILRIRGIANVDVVEGNGFLGDHYDPINRQLVLSADVYEGASTAAVGIAAHECGHAIQHQLGYAPLHWRMAAVGITNYASQIVAFLPFLFLFTHVISIYTGLFVMAVAWGIIMLFNLVTLPVEFDASNRAKAILPEAGLIRGPQEMQAVNKVLDAAALTYVAAFVTSLAYFLYYMLPLLLGGRGDRR